MSKIAKSYTENLEVLTENIVNIRNVLDEEPNLKYVSRLGEISEKALKEMAPVYNYYAELMAEFKESVLRGKIIQIEKPDTYNDYVLLHPVRQAYVFLKHLSFNAWGFMKRAERINHQVIEQKDTYFAETFGKSWETTQRNADGLVRGLRALIKKLT